MLFWTLLVIFFGPFPRSETYSKQQNLVQNLENVIPTLCCFSLELFSHYATFSELFWIPPEGLPFVCFDNLQRNGCQKIPKLPPFTFFGTVTLFLIFFRNFIKNLSRAPLNFFHTLEPTGVSQSPKGPSLLSQFWALDTKPTLAVPGLLMQIPTTFNLEKLDFEKTRHLEMPY